MTLVLSAHRALVPNVVDFASESSTARHDAGRSFSEDRIDNLALRARS